MRLIEVGMPGMQVRFNNPRQHKRILCDDFPRLPPHERKETTPWPMLW